MKAKNYFQVETNEKPFVLWTASDTIRVMDDYARHSALPKCLNHFIPVVLISVAIGILIGAGLIAIFYL